MCSFLVYVHFFCQDMYTHKSLCQVMFTIKSSIEHWKNKRQQAFESRDGHLDNFSECSKVPIQVFYECIFFTPANIMSKSIILSFISVLRVS
jgi:histidinol phosphatase-like enzyme